MKHTSKKRKSQIELMKMLSFITRSNLKMEYINCGSGVYCDFPTVFQSVKLEKFAVINLLVSPSLSSYPLHCGYSHLIHCF